MIDTSAPGGSRQLAVGWATSPPDANALDSTSARVSVSSSKCTEQMRVHAVGCRQGHGAVVTWVGWQDGIRLDPVVTRSVLAAPRAQEGPGRSSTGWCAPGRDTKDTRDSR